MTHLLPNVVVAVTASVDGRISMGPHQRLMEPLVGQRWASMQPPDTLPERGGHLDDHVVLEGSGSFIDADAEPPIWPQPRAPKVELWRDHLPHVAAKWFVVADGRGRVEWTWTGDETTRLHVLVCEATPPGYLQRLRDLEIGYFVAGVARVDLREALTRIRSVFGADQVLAMSGGTINATLFRGGLVAELEVITLPGLVGGTGTPSIMDGPPTTPADWPIRLEVVTSRVESGCVHSRYRVLKPA